MTRQVYACVLAILAVHSGSGAARAGDVILDWNQIAVEIIAADTPYHNPGMASRTLAMVNLAMYDAINRIQPVHQPFYPHDPAPGGASAEAAAAQAAYEVLNAIYPAQNSTLNTKLSDSLLLIPNGQPKTDGVSYGQTVGNDVVMQRQSDGFDDVVLYNPTGDPGHWEADPLNPGQNAWGPQWRGLQPFAISSSADYMPPPPPGIDSPEYAASFNEVKLLGAKNSATRTDVQTNIGLFWAYDRLGMGTPLAIYDLVLREVAEDQGNDLSENARLFAMASVAMADTGIVAWDSKFEYDFWRPISGIRRADEDGNPATDVDEGWEPLGAPGNGTTIDDFTPPFPAYVSGHASFGGAVFQSLIEFYDGMDNISFELTSAELTGPEATRMFTSFSEAMAENGRSRIYLGIHWDFDDLLGRALGQDVATDIAASYFQEIPEPASMVLLSLGAVAMLRRRRD